MRLGLTRGLALFSYAALILWVMAWIVFLGGLEERYISIYLLLFAGPLLIPLRGVLATRVKPMIWGTLLALPYAVHGGVVIWSGGQDVWLGVIEAALAITYVISASYFVRWRALAQQPA
jgi:uncharacterized membrane protein